eukprot:TRINITY_DN2554_c0_g1_i2.p1 TRINITY_DN2554_c0_g1~~TRINITY_DN2554_c0_g1_i2.p1  ORF type:complete len:506 (-),score=93.62 TRINITY_DN2554_c0_g1_i2:230-1747(-)
MSLKQLAAAAIVVALGAAEVGAKQLSLQARISTGECWNEELHQNQTFFPTNFQTKPDLSLLARLFDIVYAGTFKVVISKVAKEQYILTQCGQTPPTNEDVDRVAPLEPDYTRKGFFVPLQSATAMSAVHLSFLDSLGVQDRLSYVSPNAVGPCWQKMSKCGAELEDSLSKTFEPAKLETQLSSVDAVFMTCSASDCKNVKNRANGVHVPTAHELDILATAECIKYLAAFFNKEPDANKLFAAVQTSYRQASSQGHRDVVVAWINFNQNGGPNRDRPEFIVSQASYKMALTADAGATNFYAPSGLRHVVDLEVSRAKAAIPAAGYMYTLPVKAFKDKAEASAQFFAALAGVDVVVDEADAYDPTKYTFDSFLSTYALNLSSSLKFLKNKMVLRIDRTLAKESKSLDWFESRIARPDLAVEGIAQGIFGNASKRSKYVRNVARGEGVDQLLSADTCLKTLPACSADAAPAPILISFARPSYPEIDFAASNVQFSFVVCLFFVVIRGP